jgi:hypothetical protein
MERTRRTLGALIATAVVLAACGSNDDSSSSDDSGSDASTPVATSDASATEQAEVDENGTDTASASGDSGSSWCDQVRAAASSDASSPINFDFFGLSSTEIEAQFTTNVQVLEGWARTAPSEIDGSVQTIVDAYRTFVELGDAADWDLNAMATDPAFASAFESAELTAATDAVDDYNRDVCGVDLRPEAEDAAGATVPPPADGDIVAEFLAGFGLPASFLTDDQRECMNAQLSVALPEGLGADFVLDDQLLAVFDEAAENCGI